MIIKNKYIVLNADLAINSKIKESKIWSDSIVNFIYEQIQQNEYSLFELSPTNHSIIYDLDQNCKETKINSKRCLYINGVSLSKKDLQSIVLTDDFYLGNLIIIRKTINEADILNIVNFWDKNIFETGLEIFSVDNDGLSFYWYNPKDKIAEEKFDSFISELNN